MSRLIEPFASRQLLSSVSFGDGFGRAVDFTDADGTRVSLSLVVALVSAGVMADVYVKILDWPHNFGLPGGGGWGGTNSSGGWVSAPWNSYGGTLTLNG